MMLRRISSYAADETGAGAAEFALVLPVLVAFVFGFMHICMLTYSVARLHWSAEDAARCATVRAECRSGSPSAVDWGLVDDRIASTYGGLTAAPTRDPWAADACGNKVVLRTSYVLNAVIFTRTFPLTASACFPA